MPQVDSAVSVWITMEIVDAESLYYLNGLLSIIESAPIK